MPFCALLCSKKLLIYIIRKKSNVDCCFLDASKAFDKVHNVKLFNVLLSRDILPYIVRIIVNSYIRQKVRVSWIHTQHNILIYITG